MPAQLTITELAAGGDGVGQLDGRAVFVAGALPGDRVEVEVEQARGALRGTLRAILAPSPHRVAPGCPHADRCGGCQLLALDAAAQESAKEAIFYGALARIGGLARAQFEALPLVRSAAPLRYRSRAKLHVTRAGLGYSERASHRVLPIDECRLLQPQLEAAVLRLGAAIASEGAPTRCREISVACDERRVAAAFHVDGPARSALARAEWLAASARLDGGVVVGEGDAAVAFGKPVLSWPAPCAEGVTLYGRPDLFAQANTAANRALVAAAMDGLGDARAVLELYSGSGNFTFALARRGAQVTASEIAGGALELARRSAREAQLDVRFIAGDALKVGASLAREGRRFDAVLLDPPRTGARGIGAVAAGVGARRVVYVSCDPATLARDARELVAVGYRPVRAIPVDMFPQTFHLEGVLVLERA